MCKPVCLAVGAGAIGRSLSGPVFTRLGYQVIFAEIDAGAVSELNRREAYQLEIVSEGEKDVTEEITGVRACMLESAEAADAAAGADVFVTAVGEAGIGGLIPIMAEWFRKRRHKKPPVLFLFENGLRLKETLELGLRKLGALVPGTRIIPCSVERMSRMQAGGVLCEPFIPVIADARSLQECGFLDTACFQPAKDWKAYYYRKLYTNNLGHAALCYLGLPKGYATATQAAEDPAIRAVLIQALDEMTVPLCGMFGFAENELRAHNRTLLSRYRNPRLQDELLRLARDPLRKLSPGERIGGALGLLERYGAPGEGVAAIFRAAAAYAESAPDVPAPFRDLMKQRGLPGVLTEICGLNAESRFFRQLLRMDP